MKKVLATVLILSLVLAVSASAFDGARKGFVLGGGLGFAPMAKFEAEELKAYNEDKAGIALNFVIGYAWDEYNMIVYEGNVTAHNSDWTRDAVAQGFNGASWYHYFGPKGKSAFIVAGLGLYVFNAEGFDQNDPGGALILGGGYEFAPHWQFGAYLSVGKTSDPLLKYDHSHISILVGGVAF